MGCIFDNIRKNKIVVLEVRELTNKWNKNKTMRYKKFSCFLSFNNPILTKEKGTFYFKNQ